ncbi:YlcI/YnfO family protein [Yersinia wautersii]|uniref:YlcI/YnfO family protein n=1 Tax=Yersinia pseudotuberculosis TaxID=633 RepID=UPI0004065EF3|nr:YlcI/YnfO family protein [Yersinia pseudotuberculosis]
MATKAANAKSQTLAARIPHEIVQGMELVKEEGESTGQFIAASMLTEIKRRQRKKAKEELRE